MLSAKIRNFNGKKGFYHGRPVSLWQWATPLIVGWSASRTWKNNNQW